MNLLKVFFISAVPLIEQKGAIPYGIFKYDLNPLLVCLVSFLGSLIPVPFILLMFNFIFKWMKKYKIFNGINNIIENKVNKNSEKIKKYKEIGLIILVAIPLPTTGLWTGSAVAAFLRLNFKKSLMCTAVGGVISAIVITVVSVIIPSFFGY